MSKRFSYEVRMTRPDRKRVKVARVHFDHKPNVASDRQLAGYLTHMLFTDDERGGTKTHYTITERDNATDSIDVFTVERDANGGYRHA